LCVSAVDISTLDIWYHRECRSEFTHKKSLQKLKDESGSCSASSSDVEYRRSIRDMDSKDKTRVYGKQCIFCLQVTKYIKGLRTREKLRPVAELRADETIRNVATARADERLLAVTARDIVAEEAHCHSSCYKLYTKPSNSSKSQIEYSEEDTQYKLCEKSCLQNLYESIRNDLFNNPRIIQLTDLKLQLVS